MKPLFLLLTGLLAFTPAYSQTKEQNPANQSASYPVFSTAQFMAVPGTSRIAHNFNLGWRFFKGKHAEASLRDLDDSKWSLVNIPHGLELVPEESSGCSNYQGEAWYRKHFSPPVSMKGKKVNLHFEGIMGKSKIFLNGKLVKEHFGGYLPAIVDVTDQLEYGKPNVVSVWTDNSDDTAYPPGKTQKQLDFNYFGGIYRDAYLIETDKIHVTDPNQVDEEAGGGLFFYTKKAKGKSAEVGARVHLANHSEKEEMLKVRVNLVSLDGKLVSKGYEKSAALKPGESKTVAGEWLMNNVKLWSPDFPHLYYLDVTVSDAAGKLRDVYRSRVGIRTFEITAEKGLIINGKPFQDKLMGGNRHQDFAYLGNAVPNIGQWRDAKKLRDAGLRIVRAAHYPLDPAFMDAADELGLFVIVATPGWQFWNNKPQFGERVYSDIRNMVRRDRNHPGVWVWESILNETHYPADFARKAYETTHKEYPYAACYVACDSGEKGAENFDLIYAHPLLGGGTDNARQQFANKPYFTREFGDNVDSWSSHNSSSRVARKWGEVPMIVQSIHYTMPRYKYTSWDTLYKTDNSHIGGCLWHPFDHQRGYHPDPFYGGIMDAFRQTKFSYGAFQAQRPADKKASVVSGPSVFIAHAMTPFSPGDVTIFSNCEEVRLTGLEREPMKKKVKENPAIKMPAPPVVFKDAYDYMKVKNLTRAGKGGQCYLLAEGLIGGKVVASHRVEVARRPAKIQLSLDNEGVPLRANGSDFVVVVASITDSNGIVRRLNNEVVEFEVEGAAEIIGDQSIGANPRPVEWGTAPVLLKMGSKPGKVTVRAKVRNEGSQKPVGGVLEFETIASPESFIQEEIPDKQGKSSQQNSEASNDKAVQELERKIQVLEKELNLYKNKEVEKQQSDFE